MPTPEVLSTNVLHRYRIFAIVEQELWLPSGRTVVRQVVQHPGAVVIIPQMADGRLILIAQYRFAVGATLPEFPAGTLEAGEAPLDCARRELIEETGYRADHWRALGIMYPSPGYCDEQQHLFVATGLVPEHAANVGLHRPHVPVLHLEGYGFDRFAFQITELAQIEYPISGRPISRGTP